MNKIKEKPQEQIAETVQKNLEQRKKKSSRKFLKALNVFGLIEKEMLVKLMPFIFFLTGIALVYIANSYYAEKTIREIDLTAKELKELRSEYISVKSDLISKSNQSQVATVVLPIGLKESRVAPKKIVLTGKNPNIRN
ncbi:MAG TPA: FtsL-like putative cell division protein [Bacteroidia bacterium]|nr:FtsL-like putative cell division protein [Bacteroidia bacterium]